MPPLFEFQQPECGSLGFMEKTGHMMDEGRNFDLLFGMLEYGLLPLILLEGCSSQIKNCPPSLKTR
jgi:hypothetical protein